jgi:hypothetical protein
VVHQIVSGVLGWSEVNWPLSGLDDGVWLKFTAPSGGAPDCPVSRLRRTRHSRENGKGDVAIIHRTVRWCTGLSGEPTVASANGQPCNPWATRGSSNGRKGALDCPVRQRAQSCNGHLCPVWKAIVHRIGYSSCPMAHRTVWCATRQKARTAFQVCLQRLLAALGL